MKIDCNTKIGAILKTHPDAMEAIISISAKFNKLRNPVLRKVIASRTSIATASKIAGCSVDDFFSKLQPLGFVIDQSAAPEAREQNKIPAFMESLSPDKVETLDVRPVIEAGCDPFTMITARVNGLAPGMVLKLVNSFEPAPLIQLLERKGFESYVEYVADQEVNTYFKSVKNTPVTDAHVTAGQDDWEEMMQLYKDDIVSVDVRKLEMPLPMITILESLDKLQKGQALFVYHKRIPVFLLAELRERNYEYRFKELSSTEVHMLIFRR